MKDLYKQKIYDYTSSINGRLNIIGAMIDGTKTADPIEAKRYLHEIQSLLEKVDEMVSIS